MEDGARELSERVRARVGTTILGKWKVERVLGIGGMAAVYAATHRNGKRVAIKILHPEVSAIPDLRARFLREGYAANKVEHPGVVGVDDDDVTDDGAAFLVMDRVDGETLTARTGSGGRGMNVREVLDMADQLLDVLVVAHAAGVVHRDIKPDNLFLGADGRLRVLDFGIARVRELSMVATKGATYAGAVMGTPAFMPPEQARSRWADVDAKSDLWAVGATMFTLLAGRFVHDAETANEQLAQAITQKAPALLKVVPAAPASVGAVVDRALMYDKKDRFADAREMREAVQAAAAALDGLGSSRFATAPTIAATSQPPVAGQTLLTAESSARIVLPTRTRAVVLTLAGVAVALVAVSWALHNGGDPPASGAAASEASRATERAMASAGQSSVAPVSALASPPASAHAPASASAAPPIVSPSGTTLSVDALPEATSEPSATPRDARTSSATAKPPATAEGGTKTKKRRNLGF